MKIYWYEHYGEYVCVFDYYWDLSDHFSDANIYSSREVAEADRAKLERWKGEVVLMEGDVMNIQKVETE